MHVTKADAGLGIRNVDNTGVFVLSCKSYSLTWIPCMYVCMYVYRKTVISELHIFDSVDYWPYIIATPRLLKIIHSNRRTNECQNGPK